MTAYLTQKHIGVQGFSRPQIKQTRLTQKAIDTNILVQKFQIQAFYDLNFFCLNFYKGPVKQFYNLLNEKLTLRAVIFLAKESISGVKKYKLNLLEEFRQISFYLPEQFRQISFYLPEEFWQITSSFFNFFPTKGGAGAQWKIPLFFFFEPFPNLTCLIRIT